MSTPSSMAAVDSGVLEDDRLDDVRHVLDAVDRLLHGGHDVLPHEDGQRVELATEQTGLDPSVDSVALALQAVDGVEVGLDAPHRFQLVDKTARLLADLDEDVRLLFQFGQQLVEAHEAE